MGDWAIRCEGLGKRYRSVGDADQGGVGRQILTALHAAGDERLDDGGRWFWALKDVSFTLNQGEVLGLVGANGAGKSTLLKILSRLTEPTEGEAWVKGRVGSMLEVGTGFNPELTGRENVYMSGALLGMSRVEVRASFDAIVDFAGVETFIDTPIKHYSSGMYMRLAFAVAAFLRTEILLVDEVLAVGDLSFQRKCMAKMTDLARSGRTVVFVSHATDVVAKLCTHALMLERGQATGYGNAKDVSSLYISSLGMTPVVDLTAVAKREGAGKYRFTQAWVEDESGTPSTTIKSGAPCRFVATFDTCQGAPAEVVFGVSIYTDSGRWLTDLSNYFQANHVLSYVPEQGRVEFTLDRLPLTAGRYSFNIIVRSARVGLEVQDWLTSAIVFEVAGGSWFVPVHTGDSSHIVWLDYEAECVAEQPA
jgi:lipopolysaccharide transport system ATP-binding protein